MVAVLLLAFIKRASAQQKLLDHLVVRQCWSLRPMLMLKFYQASKKLLCIGLSKGLEMFVPPGQRTVLKLCNLAGCEETLFRL